MLIASVAGWSPASFNHPVRRMYTNILKQKSETPLIDGAPGFPPVAVALAAPAHGPQTAEDGRFDVDEVGPSRRWTGYRGASSGIVERMAR